MERSLFESSIIKQAGIASDAASLLQDEEYKGQFSPHRYRL